MRHFDPWGFLPLLKDLVLLILPAGAAAWAWYKTRHAHSWPSAHGTIMGAEVRASADSYIRPWVGDLTYSYIVNREYYAGFHRLRARSERRAEEKVAGWKGRTVVVRYSPRKHDLSTLLRRRSGRRPTRELKRGIGRGNLDPFLASAHSERSYRTILPWGASPLAQVRPANTMLLLNSFGAATALPRTLGCGYPSCSSTAKISSGGESAGSRLPRASRETMRRDVTLHLLMFFFTAAVAFSQSDYKVVTVTDGGTVSGTVKWSGSVPRSLQFPITKDQLHLRS
jgi:hypothetical protein